MTDSAITTLLEAQLRAGFKNSEVQKRLGWDAAKWHRIVTGKQDIYLKELNAWANAIDHDIVHSLKPTPSADGIE